MKAIEWDEVFDTSYSIINLPPEQYVFYRGHNVNFPLSNRPAYFGTIDVAKQYSKKPGHTLSAFTNGRKLRLLDLRFMKYILRDIFEANAEQYILDDDMKSVTLSFGLCSLNHQISMANQRFKNSLSELLDPNQTLTIQDALQSLQSSYKNTIYEQPGVRIAETTNDSFSMGFLKGLFEHNFDGYISPQSYSPFHIERANNILMSELIIFNPLKCRFRNLDTVPKNIVYEDMYDIYVHNKMYALVNNKVDKCKYKMHMQSGGSENVVLPSVELLHQHFDSNIELQNNYDKGLQSGNSFVSFTFFSEFEAPPLCFPVNPWPKTWPPTKTQPTLLKKSNDYEILSPQLSFVRRRKTFKNKHKNADA